MQEVPAASSTKSEKTLVATIVVRPQVAAVAAATPVVSDTSSMVDRIRTAASAYNVDAGTAIAIARCESGLLQYNKDGSVLRGRVTPKDVGVFQVNEYYHLAKSKELGFNIYTTEGNINYALWLMKNEGTKHWVWSKHCWQA